MTDLQEQAVLTEARPGSKAAPRGIMADGRRRSWFSILVMAFLVLLWTVPTLGLLVTSLRSRDAQAETGWWTALWNGGWTFENYRGVFESTDIGTALLNSVIVAIPATVIPIMFAAFAAYAFTFMDFRGKDVLFIVIVAVMVVPIQVAFSPLLNLLGPNGLGISGQYIAVWLLHTGFGMPLAIYTFRNYMTTLPKTVIESAKIDGATHFQTFWKLIVPMSVPALAAFAILQFLWVWNDLLIAKLFLTADNTTVIVELQGLLGAQGQGTELPPGGRVHLDDDPDDRVLHAAAVLRPRPDRRRREGLMPRASLRRDLRTCPPDAGGREPRARALPVRCHPRSCTGARRSATCRPPTSTALVALHRPGRPALRAGPAAAAGLVGETGSGFTGLPGLEGVRPGRTAGAWAPRLRDWTCDGRPTTSTPVPGSRGPTPRRAGASSSTWS